MEAGRRAGRAVIFLVALALLLGPAATARGAAWVELGQGRSGGYSFLVEGKRGDAAGLCLRVSVLHRHGRFSFDRSRFRSCAGAGGELHAGAAPLLAGGAQLGRAPGSGLSVFAALFAPAVRGVWLGFDRSGSAMQVQPLGEAGVGVGLGRARLGVVVLDRAACPTRAISRGSGGSVLWDSGAGLDCGGFEAIGAP
jgi:hypothetical protein